MASKKQQKTESSGIETSLSNFSRNIGSSGVRKRGAIHLTFTDSGAEYFLEGSGREVKVSRGISTSPAVVRIAGPADRLQAVIDGKKEASRAFIEGGIQVSGDLTYLEALLKDLGLLKCE